MKLLDLLSIFVFTLAILGAWAVLNYPIESASLLLGALVWCVIGKAVYQLNKTNQD